MAKSSAKSSNLNPFCVVTHRKDPETGRSLALDACIVEAPFFARVAEKVLGEMPDATIVSVIPIQAFGGWIEMRDGKLLHVQSSSSSRGSVRRVTAFECQHAAKLLLDRHFSALAIANAVGGDRTMAWALVHAGFSAEELDQMSARLIDEVRPKAAKAAVELRRYAADRSVRLRLDAEWSLQHLSHAIDEIAGPIPAHPNLPRKDDREDRLSDEAGADRHAVGRIDNDHVIEHYRRSYDPAWLLALADKWEAWANGSNEVASPTRPESPHEEDRT